MSTEREIAERLKKAWDTSQESESFLIALAHEIAIAREIAAVADRLDSASFVTAQLDRAERITARQYDRANSPAASAYTAAAARGDAIMKAGPDHKMVGGAGAPGIAAVKGDASGLPKGWLRQELDALTPEDEKRLRGMGFGQWGSAPAPVHASDCALHNGPAYEPGPCDCGAEPDMTPERKLRSRGFPPTEKRREIGDKERQLREMRERAYEGR